MFLCRRYVQPSCPFHTNVLHIHSAHDSYNTPVDPPNGTKPGGAEEIGRPTTLRSNWLAPQIYGPARENGAAGQTSGAFTHYAAAQGNITCACHRCWSLRGRYLV